MCFHDAIRHNRHSRPGCIADSYIEAILLVEGVLNNFDALRLPPGSPSCDQVQLTLSPRRRNELIQLGVLYGLTLSVRLRDQRCYQEQCPAQSYQAVTHD